MTSLSIRGKRSRIAAAALLLIALLSVLAVRSDWFVQRAVQFDTKGQLLVVANDRYEIAFQKTNGGIAYVRDKAVGKNITVGNRKGALWWAFLEDNTSINSAEGASKFSYEWQKSTSRLLLHYSGKLGVDVTASFDESSQIRLSADVVNNTAQTLQSFRFPYELKFAADDVLDGMLPMLPGAKLKPAFFKENNAYVDQYPGVMFAAYTALRTSGGNLAVYDISEKPTITTELGFKNQSDDAGSSAFVHEYNIWSAPQAHWQSPVVVLEVGSDYPASIASYRMLNGIDKYRSLADKLGSDLRHTAELPMLKLDVAALGKETWSTLASRYVDMLPYSGMLHLVGFQTGGHDENYPDFIPPDPKWGGAKAFDYFIKHAKEKGNQIVPYTNFSWWGVHAKALAKLPDGVKLDDIVVKKPNGTLMKEDYGEHSGYVMNMNDSFVTNRIAEEHKKLLDAGVSGIFEDQWGIRNAPFMKDGVQPDNTDAWSAYFEGVRNYFVNAGAKQRMYTEDGTDVLAGDSIGFMGTNYLWDLLGYRKNTATYTDYYPLAGMLMRDKVMFYQHNLAAETMTDNKDMLRWNAAMGYNLSGDLYTGVANPWIELIGVFQKVVLAGYADQVVQSYDSIDPTTTRTDFGTYTVIANWDTGNGYVLDDQTTLSSGGFDIAAKDGSVRAGSYTRYNGYNLDPGEHYLAESRSKDEIRLYQPIGSDTTVRFRSGEGWAHAIAAAYDVSGKKLVDLPVTENGEFVQVDYIASINKHKTAYIALTPSKSASTVKDIPFHKVKELTNLALRQPFESSTNANTELVAKLAGDGDDFTYWESVSNKFPQELIVDLGDSKQVQKLVLKLPPLDAWGARDQGIEVQGSEDGEHFKVIAANKAYTFDPAKANTVEAQLAAPASVRYVRLVFTSNTGWPAAQISELQVYGSS
ncbi:F5/8 type C domain-containing protein [Paenibacillus taihuensis]|uniref:F5/8 type C domain-containing protein n=1 Tax=Paenibacillus taihuensis TaxID=1156355 RepID=A0A3D9QWY1_9BACL|nr:discoidin domain-containing protein [Paenibacillus taihuensis]REE70497.1 F5/8 type C domain-containing protein [Paenibacillus taihuensis]